MISDRSNSIPLNRVEEFSSRKYDCSNATVKTLSCGSELLVGVMFWPVHYSPQQGLRNYCAFLQFNVTIIPSSDVEAICNTNTLHRTFIYTMKLMATVGFVQLQLLKEEEIFHFRFPSNHRKLTLRNDGSWNRANFPYLLIRLELCH